MTENDRHASPPPPAAPGTTVDEMIQRIGELERFNRALVDERQSLKAQVDDCRRLLRACTTGILTLDKNGLITHANERAAAMLGMEAPALLKKPLSLFITPEDQAVFYINRSRVISGAQKAPIEINFRKQDGTRLPVRMGAQAIETQGQSLPGLLLAVEDISAYRQAVEALQFQEDCLNLLFSIIDDLSAWSSADIDEIIRQTLEKIGLVSGADRVYVCLFHARKTRLSISHEWVGEGIDPPDLRGAPLDTFLPVVDQVRHRQTVSIPDVGALSAAERAAQAGFHVAGAKSLLFTPLYHGRSLLGIIGCDAVRQTVAWSRESERLIQSVGVGIVNALLRREIEGLAGDIRGHLFRFVGPPGNGAGDDIQDYDGPIEIVGDADEQAGEAEPAWDIREGRPAEPQAVNTVLLKDGKTANLACRHCNRQKLLDISEIRTLGTQLMATCICGNAMYVKIELRREHRKTVSLDGVFIRGPGDRLALKSDDWGRIQVCNLSRRGIAFKTLGDQDIRVDDRFRVKFTLDNTAGSVIQKQVVVRSIAEGVVGCQFEGKDTCDVSLGFYMMT